MPRRRVIAALSALVLAVSATACGSSSGTAKKSATPSRSRQAAPSPTPSLTYHPFNGGDTGLTNPVIAVKIDNTRPAHPQQGLQSADIVYVEQVEGGETRLMAIFSSKLPARLGPVRSARISDLHILAAYGKPAFAFSGVQSKMKPLVKAASLFDVSDDGTRPYVRDGSRSAPYNLFVDPHKLLAATPQATPPHDIGFRFGPAPAGGRPLTTFTAKWPVESMRYDWSAKDKRYLVSHNGTSDDAAEGGQLGGQTVVIQYARTDRSQFHDFLGSYTPLIHTTGTGKALVLRDGMAYDCTWSKPTDTSPTTFTTASGQPMAFAPGQVWVNLVNDGPTVIP